MRPSRLTLATALFLLAALPSPAQIVTDMRGEQQGGGVITTTHEGAIEGAFGTADGIIFEWEKTLKEFEEFDGAKEIDRRVNELQDPPIRIGEFNLPQMLDENGIDLFLLTEDGVTIYMAMSAPVYLQDTTADLVKWIRYYAYQKRSYTARMFARYAQWEATIKKAFADRGVPEEIAELCMVESGCTYKALSPVGALGMWQIMPETGRAYGMTINGFLDERLDPMTSTLTAAKILRRNYDRIGDWTFAIAAYNCGPGRFLKKENKGRSWPDMSRILPRETQQYIPSLMAIHYVWTYKDKLGLQADNQR